MHRTIILFALSACDTSSQGIVVDGKDNPEGVAETLEALTVDGELSADEMEELFESAGGKVSRDEMLVIRDGLESTDYVVTDDAKAFALELALYANLHPYEADHLSSTNLTYAGSETPQAVRDLLAKARLNGAAVYDVREVDDDDGELVWTHYPAESAPSANMTFEYTEITNEALQADMDAVDLEYNMVSGSEHLIYSCPAGATTLDQCDLVDACPAGEECVEYDAATYTTGVGGTGHVASHYDEVHHDDLFARGRQGQKWANNCAFLSDGSIHCLPAVRRSEHTQGLIVTNPALSHCSSYWPDQTACKQLMYNGHIDINAGRVVGVEVSGIPSKRVARGKVNLVDPIALLEAWGIPISSGVQVRWGNTNDGVPVRNVERGVIEEDVATP